MPIKPYRVTIAVDIEAKSREQALGRTFILCGDIEGGRPWVREALPGGVEERKWINQPKGE